MSLIEVAHTLGFLAISVESVLSEEEIDGIVHGYVRRHPDMGDKQEEEVIECLKKAALHRLQSDSVSLAAQGLVDVDYDGSDISFRKREVVNEEVYH